MPHTTTFNWHRNSRNDTINIFHNHMNFLADFLFISFSPFRFAAAAAAAAVCNLLSLVLRYRGKYTTAFLFSIVFLSDRFCGLRTVLFAFIVQNKKTLTKRWSSGQGKQNKAKNSSHPYGIATN